MKSHPLLPGANLLTPVLLWVGPPIHNFIRRIAMGLWGHPESEQSHQKQVHAGAVILYDPLGKCPLSVRLVCSTIPELWGLYAICNFHLIFRALHTCWIKSATRAVLLSDSILVVTQLWELFLEADSEPLHLLFQFGWGSRPPILSVYITRPVNKDSVSRVLSR